jgi:regulator of RNase E activity RraB
VALLATVLNLFGCAKKPGPDESVLTQLKKAGSDLSKPHNIEFFLYFPTQGVAEQAASKIRDQGFRVEVGRAAKGGTWMCHATKTMIPDLPALQKICEDFTSLANSLNGEYDGWGTPVVK